MNELALFTGAGGGLLASHLLGWRTVCAVEIDEFARRVLVARQNDGIFGPFPIWDDVRTFDGRPWRGAVDVVSGGFPCVDVSIARAMWGRAGIEGEHSGLWAHYRRIVEEVEPVCVFGENSPELRSQGLCCIVRELASLGFVSRWGTIGADDLGQRHRRKRCWFVATHTDRARLERHARHGSDAQGRQESPRSAADAAVFACPFCGYRMENDDAYGCPNCNADGLDEGSPSGRDPRPGLLTRVTGMADGVADRLDRIRTIGNGQVPRVAAAAWEILK